MRCQKFFFFKGKSFFRSVYKIQEESDILPFFCKYFSVFNIKIMRHTVNNPLTTRLHTILILKIILVDPTAYQLCNFWKIVICRREPTAKMVICIDTLLINIKTNYRIIHFSYNERQRLFDQFPRRPIQGQITYQNCRKHKKRKWQIQRKSGNIARHVQCHDHAKDYKDRNIFRAIKARNTHDLCKKRCNRAKHQTIHKNIMQIIKNSFAANTIHLNPYIAYLF